VWSFDPAATLNVKATEEAIFSNESLCIALHRLRCHKVEHTGDPGEDSPACSLLFFDPAGTLLVRLDGADARSVVRVAREVERIWVRSFEIDLPSHTRRMAALLDLRDKVEVKTFIFRRRWEKYRESPTREAYRKLAAFVKRLRTDRIELRRRERAIDAEVKLRTEFR